VSEQIPEGADIVLGRHLLRDDGCFLPILREMVPGRRWILAAIDLDEQLEEVTP
jgi:hypothetical protein